MIFFLKYYKYYLLHSPFILCTDNRALTWIRSLESPTGMILRWLEILASFDFTIPHRKGTLHGNADSLSRAPHATFPTPLEEKVLVSDEGVMVTAIQAPPGFTLGEMREHQERDDLLQGPSASPSASCSRQRSKSTCWGALSSPWHRFSRFKDTVMDLGCRHQLPSGCIVGRVPECC